ncbi:hypothetical protein ACFPRL_25585 [Pseudoclavibacter helvolus]
MLDGRVTHQASIERLQRPDRRASHDVVVAELALQVGLERAEFRLRALHVRRALRLQDKLRELLPQLQQFVICALQVRGNASDVARNPADALVDLIHALTHERDETPDRLHLSCDDPEVVGVCVRHNTLLGIR